MMAQAHGQPQMYSDVYYPSPPGHDYPSPPGHDARPPEMMPSFASQGLNTEYPVPMGVRNTFLHFPVERSDSLDGYLNDRQCSSAPSAPKYEGGGLASVDEIEIPDEGGQDVYQGGYGGIPALPHAASLPSSSGTHHSYNRAHERTIHQRQHADRLQQRQHAEMLQQRQHAELLQQRQHAEIQAAAAHAAAQSGSVLHLADILANPGPPQDTGDCPTIGSVNHAIGKCKPCAFFWKQAGCGNGYECPFCHLCGPDEKKRRRKERQCRTAAVPECGVRLSLKEGLRRILQ